MAAAAAAAAVASPAASPTECTFDLTRFPLEIRDLIWEASLPHYRVFHVSGTVNLGRTAGPRNLPAKALRFHINHAPPAAAHVCRESRAVALRHGGFLFAPAGASLPGPWFNPHRDLLYFDRTRREPLRFQGGQPTIFVQGWQHVLHLALDWGFFFHCNADKMLSWGRIVRALRRCMPNLEAVHYLFLQEPHQEATTWLREQDSVSKYEAVLVPLPETAGISLLWTPSSVEPWFKRNPLPARLLRWGKIRQFIQEAVEAEDNSEFKRERPQVKGWWLMRRGACLVHPTGECCVAVE